MNREDYLLELDDAGRELGRRARVAAEAANPLNGLRESVAENWKWWLPAAAVAGFAVARTLSPAGRTAASAGGGGAAFWIPTLVRLLPTVTAQIVPLILSLRSPRGE
jgi:hypothetical protein